MSHRTSFSPQTVVVLALLHERPDAHWHGYDIARRTGLKSGTLYPILVRLAERGLLDAAWEADQPAGRPRRHLYRLTGEGLRQAGAVLASTTAGAEARIGRPGKGPRGAAIPDGGVA
jgi:DNA-binding PadR family transcriptional regulator